MFEEPTFPLVLKHPSGGAAARECVMWYVYRLLGLFSFVFGGQKKTMDANSSKELGWHYPCEPHGGCGMYVVWGVWLVG